MAWVESKLMWNPDLPLDALLDEFFAGYYGDAAPFVREYFEELHRLEYDYTADPNHALGMTTPPTNPAIPDSFLDEATELWAKAAEAVTGDRTREYNVRMGAITVDYMRLERLRAEIAKTICLAPETRVPEKFSKAQRLARKLLVVLATEKNIQLSEGGNAGRAKALIEENAGESFFSAASVWEVAIKNSMPKRFLGISSMNFVHEALSMGFRNMDVTTEHSAIVETLPPIHGDPFDRMLVAQAMVEGCTLVTHDDNIAKYGEFVKKV